VSLSTDNWNRGRITERAAGQGAREKARTAGAGASSWNKGAQGEAHVGRLLDSLDPKHWTVLHDLPLDTNWNIDHLVIGPTGVFVIDTKNLSGTVLVNGSEIEHNGFQVNYVEKMAEVVQRVRQNLCSAAGWNTLWVQGILAFIGARLEIEAFPHDLCVVRANNLVPILRTWNNSLSWRQRQVLSEAALNPRTWR
jgi:hypothetical protein